MRIGRAFLTLTVLSGLIVFTPSPASATPGFISAQGTELRLDGAPFRFTGLNVYNANSDGWCWFEYSDADFDQALTDMGPGVNVIRAWFFQPLATTPTGQRDWTRFDRTLEIAGTHGIRVIVTLTDQWGECGATSTNPYKDRTWYESGYETDIPPDNIVSYKDWVAEVVSRYKDDPNVAFWQLINEAEINEVVGGVPQACPPGDEPADILRAWAQDVGGLVKSIDANHLVSLGTIGNGQCGAQGAQYEYVHDIPQIDLCEYHDYGSPNVGIPGDQWNGLQVRLDQCATLRKPLFVGEAGISPDEVGGTLQDRADAFAAKMSAQLRAGVAGFLAWAWSSLGSTTDNYDIGPADPVLDAFQVPAGVPAVTDLTAGSEHTCAVMADGSVRCWGNNSNGQIGDGTTAHRHIPTPVSGIPDVVGVSAGGEHTCAVTVAGQVWCWGTNQYGQLGVGGGSTFQGPTLVPNIPAMSIVDAGSVHTCALSTLGEVWCWGYNTSGQTGNGSTSQTASPAPVSGLPAVDQLAIGGYHSCARSGSEVFCWGSDQRGQVGDGPPMDFSQPTPQAVTLSDTVAIASGTYHTCALSADGGLSCWGHGEYGEIGDDGAVDRAAPVSVPGIDDATAVSAGANRGGGSAHSCAKTGTGVRCWGSNWAGQLGDGTTTQRNVPASPVDLPMNLQTLHAGGNHTCAVITSWSVSCWGDNAYGQLGNGLTGQSSVPVDVDFTAQIDPPTAPQNPVAVAGDQSATVTWQAPASDGGGAISEYTVISQPGGFTANAPGTQLTATVTGLTNGTSYRFRVVATNAAGDGPASVLSNAVTPKGVPGVPQNVTATPGSGLATVSWNAPISNGGGAINGYVLTATSSSSTVTKTVTATTFSTNITGLTNGTSYSITVQARNVVGKGPPSPAIDVTPFGVPGAPTGTVATAGNASASISWTPPASNGGRPITSYTVTSNVGGFSKTVDASQTTTTITGLVNGVAYRFRVYATNVAGNGPPSAYSTAVTPKGVPGAPTQVSAVAGNGAATVTWTAPASSGGSAITNYVVTSSGGQTTTVSGSVRSALVGGLTNGTPYTFSVVARNAIGDGPAGTSTVPVTPSDSVNPIVFGSNRSGSNSYDIYVINPDGSGLARIVGRTGNDQDPALSPDGTEIVFTSGTGTAMEIWTANIDGSGLTQLTCNSVADSAPNWSPDGSQIVFQSLQNSGTDYEIYVMPVQTCGTGTMLTDNSATDTAPAFSPDGSHIAFSSNRISNPEIWVMQSNGGSPTRLTTRTGSDLTPAWSPDGSRIAWTAGYSTGENHVWAMDADGQHQVDLTLVTATAVKDLAPAWSPDGTTIVFASTRAQSPNTDLYTMVADGTGVIRLTNATNNDTTPDW